MNPALQRTCPRIFFASYSSHVAKYSLQALYHNIVLSSRRNFSSVTCRTSIRRASTTSTKQAERPFEEERLPGYSHEQFYPIHIGDTLKSRYVVVGKLGYGANSTVWLCRDTNNDEFVAVKVYVKTSQHYVHLEQVAYAHLSSIRSAHPGRLGIRDLLDWFHLPATDGSRHYCLVHQPLHTTLFDLQRFGGSPRPFPEDLVKGSIFSLLETLDFLHTEASMTHCDIKPSNIMLEIEDTSVLSTFAENERTNPVPRKVIDERRTIYGSRKLSHPQGHAFGRPILCDFGEARIGSRFPYKEIQPEVYKAPEILLQLPWNHQVDIWNTACVAWDMIKISHLFDGHDEEGYHNNRVHIGEMVGLLGHPPVEMQRQSAHAWRVFDEQGKWKNNPPLSPDTLEDRLTCLNGQSKAEFLSFLRAMLKWQPQDRKTAREVLQDPWLANCP
ncbi:hypothetical protein CKM354_000733100 [Cercospora kikuchii]|uniref:non-specific serine/threonine protein kinase n=1 Tax=Cercospora kikuchii TaxID=84275 RepID=A0A9P3CMJ1_9PEZI|nr:uncharacterized protein CKM354_000733100 [Cercospora kikuchii]GIZ44122.1 hypothetical protein CKM354_000733100 [Cercospora kikuchii]